MRIRSDDIVGEFESAFDNAGVAVVVRLEPANEDQEVVRLLSHSKLLTVAALESFPVAVVVYIVHY